MRKTDISHFNDEAASGSAVSTRTAVGGVFSAVGKFLLTGFAVLLITSLVVGISMIVYIIGIASEPVNINLNKIKLSLTSFVYVKNDNDVFKISIQEFKKYGIQVLEEKNLSPKSCSLICKKNDEIIEFIIINEGDPAYKQINDDFMQEERKFFNSESCFRLYYCGWSCNIY